MSFCLYFLALFIFVNLKLSATRFLSSSVQSILTENFLGKGGKSTMARLFASKSRNEEHELSILSEYLSTNFSWLLACRLVATTFSRKWVFWTIFTLLLVLHRKSLACRLFFLKSIRNCRNTHKRKKKFLVFCNFVCVCIHVYTLEVVDWIVTLRLIDQTLSTFIFALVIWFLNNY